MVWLNVIGYDGEYQLSEKGNLRRITQNHVRDLKSFRASNGKLYVTLWNGGRRKVVMLHNLYADTFGVSVKEAKQILYDGYKGKPSAKDNIRKWLLDKIGECEYAQSLGMSMNDEILYLKSFLKALND